MLIPTDILFMKFINCEQKGNFKDQGEY